MPNTKDFWWGVALTISIIVIACLASGNAHAETDLAWCHSLPGANAATCDIYPAKPLNDLHEAYNACVASGRERCEASIVGIMNLRRPEPLQRR